MMAMARCRLPTRLVPASHTDVPGRAVGLRALQTIVPRAALFCPRGRSASACTEPISPLEYGVGCLAAVRSAAPPTSVIH